MYYQKGISVATSNADIIVVLMHIAYVQEENDMFRH